MIVKHEFDYSVPTQIHWLLLLSWPSAGLHACSAGIRNNFFTLQNVTFADLPACTLVRFVVACIAFVDAIAGLPACSGGVRRDWFLPLLLPSVDLPACPGEIKQHDIVLLLSRLLGFPPALVGVVVAVEQTI